MIGENTKKVKEEEKKREKMPNAYLKFSFGVVEMIVMLHQVNLPDEGCNSRKFGEKKLKK